MLTIWKNFLTNRRPGALPALVALAIINLAVMLANTLDQPWLMIAASIFWVFAWFFALPAVIYTMDHRPKAPRVPRHQLN